MIVRGVRSYRIDGEEVPFAGSDGLPLRPATGGSRSPAPTG